MAQVQLAQDMRLPDVLEARISRQAGYNLT